MSSDQAESLVGRIIGRSVWLYASNVTNQVFGLVYWIILSSIAGTVIVGLTSASIGLALLLGATANLGTTMGLQRYLGKAFSKNDYREAAEYFWSTITVIGGIYSAITIILVILAASNLSLGAMTPQMIYVSSIIIMVYLLYYTQILLISKLETLKILVSTIAANIAKLLTGIPLTIVLSSWLGAALGFIVYYMVLGLIGFYYILLMNIKPRINIRKSFTIIKAGLANWIPNIIALSGQWLGVLALFNFTNPSLTGSYYIVSTIVLAILSLTNSIYNLTLPVLSGLNDQRKRINSLILKAALVLTLPIFILLFTYPGELLSLLNIRDIEAPTMMRLLILGSIITIISSNISILVYAYGKYNKALAIGVSQNLPRVVMYYILTPIMKGVGAALSYIVGSITGLVASLYTSYKVKYNIDVLIVLKIIVVPLLIAAPVIMFKLPFALGSTMIIGTYLIYIKIGVINTNEIVLLVSELPYNDKIISTLYRLKNIISRSKE